MTTQTEAPSEARALAQAETRRTERIGVLLSLGWLSAIFLLLATQYVPRVANNVWSDSEFSGWVAAMAHRLHLGERMYHELVLPIPPGAIWLLAQVERFTGRPSMLVESWGCAICHLLMALSAYALASPFTKRRTALFVSASALVFVIQIPKELLYDHTAQVVSWASLALLLRGLLAFQSPKRSVWLFSGGLVAGLVCIFKQSTAIGAIGGGLLAIAYLAFASHRRAEPRSLRSGIVALSVYGLAVALGLALTIGFIVAIGGSVPGFFQTVFTDGSALKGGWKVLVARMLSYTTTSPTLPLPLVLVALGAALGVRIARQGEGFVVPSKEDETQAALAKERAPIPLRELAFILLIATVTFGGAAALLASFADPGRWLLPARIVQLVTTYFPILGTAFGAVFFVASLPRRGREGSARADALSALLLAVVVAAIGHNGSVREARFFYDNNAIVAFGLLCLFLAVERARAPWLVWTTFALVMVSVLGGKMDRYRAAREPVAGDGFWAGMYVNKRGEKILDAAARIRELTSPDDEVLVLPEDVSLAALIGRPRPKLCGAIVFVDQYPERCLSRDLSHLENHPPKVIVAYPSNEGDWQRMYQFWSSRSPAGFLNRAFLRHHLPARYRLDSSYPSSFWGSSTSVEIYVRQDGERPLAN